MGCRGNAPPLTRKLPNRRRSYAIRCHCLASYPPFQTDFATAASRDTLPEAEDLTSCQPGAIVAHRPSEPNLPPG